MLSLVDKWELIAILYSYAGMNMSITYLFSVVTDSNCNFLFEDLIKSRLIIILFKRSALELLYPLFVLEFKGTALLLCY